MRMDRSNEATRRTVERQHVADHRADGCLVEAVEVLSTTAYDDLPPPAVARLGIAPGQWNVLLRVTLRALDRTLTHDECNVLRDEVYAALHAGTVYHWASRDRPASSRTDRAG